LKKHTIELNDTELWFLQVLFDDLHDQYAAARCNDLWVPYSDEAFQIIDKIHKEAYGAEETAEIVERFGKKCILTSDSLIFDWMQKKFPRP